MEPESKRIWQLLSCDPKDLLWFTYVIGIAWWAHRAATPMHQLRRWQARRRRRRDLNRRIRLLRNRIANGCWGKHGDHVALAELSPKLDQICSPLRRANEEIVLANIDQDGFVQPHFAEFWGVPCVDADAFLPRHRLELCIVDRDGWIGVRKNYCGDKLAFANELEAALDLSESCSHVPAILGVDFERLYITFSYVNGVVAREALAQAGAPMRDRDVRLGPPGLVRRIERERHAAGRRLINQVFDRETIGSVGDALLSVHRAGYTLEDIKYGNVIIGAGTSKPYLIDYERALSLRDFSRATATYLRDRDAEKLNALFGTNLLTARELRRVRVLPGGEVYSPLYAGAGLWWGPIWNPDLGELRWRHMLANHVPVPNGGRVLDLGANNGFNALQMLRAGAKEVIGVEIDGCSIEQGLFLKRIFEWVDNTRYRFSYVQGSHADVGSMHLGRFDLVTAFCTLYYLSVEAMAKTVSEIAQLSDTLALQCNNDRSIQRSDPETFEKASLLFNIDLLRKNGFPNVAVIEKRGSKRPLVIARVRYARNGGNS